MKNNWQIKKLGEFCKITTGNSNTVDAVDDGQYAFFDRSKIIKKSNDFLFDAEALIIPGEGAEFFPRYYSGKFNLHQRAYALLNFKNDVDIKFIEYFLISNHKYFERVAVGATAKSLRRRHFEDLEIPLPPLFEQHRIVKILDLIFEKTAKAKENAENNLQNARELFESYLQSVFSNPSDGWEEKTLGEVLQKTETVDPTKSPNKEFIYIDVSSVNKETLAIENTALIKGKDAPSRARKRIKTNDVIFATVRPTLRRIVIIPNEFNEQVCSTGYFVLRTKEHLNNKLVFYFLRTNGFNEQMEKLQKGASYPAVTDGEVRRQIIPYPKSLIEQQTIITKFDALSAETKKLEAIYQQKLDDLEELKKSILQKAFNGELAGAYT